LAAADYLVADLTGMDVQNLGDQDGLELSFTPLAGR
jgi:hypothetical protein